MEIERAFAIIMLSDLLVLCLNRPLSYSIGKSEPVQVYIIYNNDPKQRSYVHVRETSMRFDPIPIIAMIAEWH